MAKVPDDHTLNTECKAFSKYLIHQEPNSYVMAKYRQAHGASDTLRYYQPNLFDEFLLGISRSHVLLAKMVDSYTCFFSRRAIVRKKMVLVIALLESCAPSYAYFDAIDSGGYSKFLLRMFRQGILFASSLLLAIVFFAPFHILFAVANQFAQLEQRAAESLWAALGISLPSGKSPRDRTNPTELPPDVPSK